MTFNHCSDNPSRSLYQSGKGLCLAALLLCTLQIGCGTALDLETARQFQEVESAFATATTTDEFSRVAARYDQLLNEGLVSGVVLYNQGNAWMRAERPGRAIAAWRQAQRYRPRDLYLQANLQSALTMCRNTHPLALDNGVTGYLFFWQDWLSYSEKFVLASALLVTMCLISLIGRFVVSDSLRRRLTVCCGMLFVLSALSCVRDWQRFDRTIHGVVIQEDVEARKGNSETYEPALTEPLGAGAEFEVLEQRADWCNIELNELGTAWIPTRAVVIY